MFTYVVKDPFVCAKTNQCVVNVLIVSHGRRVVQRRASIIVYVV